MDLLAVETPQPPRFDASIDAWVLTQYADVERALRDHRLSAGSDGDWHASYRRAAVEAFSGRNLEVWRHPIEQEARRVCRLLKAKDSFDLRTDFAEPWSAAVSEIVTGESGNQARACAGAIFAAAAEPFDAELQTKGHDATRRLAEAFPGVLAPLYVQAFVALSESLPAFLANSCYALLQHRRWGEPLSDLEELLRYAGPAKAQLRRASNDISDAVPVKKGQRVVLMLASANRDANVFVEPEALNLMRSPNPHVAFGAGPHSCLGGSIVRLASRIAFRVLFESFAELKVITAFGGSEFALRAISCLRASPSTTLRPDRH